MSRGAAIALLAGYLAAITIAVVSAGRAATSDDGHRRQIGYGQIRYDGAGPERWAARYRRAHEQLVDLRATLRHERRMLLADPHVVEAINLAAATYGYSTTLWRKARCETGGTFDPRARNRSSSATGLFQFLLSTWRSTPYGVFARTSPYANALAAGWMHANGRGDEWSCQ